MANWWYYTNEDNSALARYFKQKQQEEESRIRVRSAKPDPEIQFYKKVKELKALIEEIQTDYPMSVVPFIICGRVCYDISQIEFSEDVCKFYDK